MKAPLFVQIGIVQPEGSHVDDSRRLYLEIIQLHRLIVFGVNHERVTFQLIEYRPPVGIIGHVDPKKIIQ